MKPEAVRYFVTGGGFLVIGLILMSIVGLTIWNGLVTLLGAIELIYAFYINSK